MIERKIRVLIVEDEMTDAALLQRQIEKVFKEPEIRVSDTLQNVRYTSKTFVPHFVFTDYNLVGFSGEDVLLELKDMFSDIPVIVVTGTLNSEELAANTILKGASGFFLKKDMNTLHQRIEPLAEKILKSQEYAFRRLEQERREREELAKVHAKLKEAANIDNEDENAKNYYKKLLSEIGDTINTIIK